jgi:hypothetical protein
MPLAFREGDGTSNIRTSNIESIFRMIRTPKDQNVKNQNVKVLVHFLAKNILMPLAFP